MFADSAIRIISHTAEIPLVLEGKRVFAGQIGFIGVDFIKFG